MLLRATRLSAIANAVRNLFRGASLNMNFAGADKLDPRITFSRASNATVTGPDGVLGYAPHNLLTHSEQFDNAVWTKSNVTPTSNSTLAPDGTNTADTLVEAAVASSFITGRSVGVSPGELVVFSVFAKAKERSVFNLRVTDGVTGFARKFDVLNGTSAIEDVASTDAATLFGVTNEGNGWYRCWVAARMVGSSTNLQIRLNNNGDGYTGDGVSGFYIWGAQLNVGPLQPYYPTTVKNLLGYTQEFDNAAWTKSNATVTANAIAAPDGSLTADLLEKTATAFASVVQGGVSTALSIQTGSVYVKSNGTLSRVSLALVNSTSATVIARGTIDLTTGALTNFTGSGLLPSVNVGDGWWRVAIQGAAVDASTRFLVYPDQHNFAVAGGIYIWGAQLSDSASLDPYVYNPDAAPTAQAYYGPRFDYDPVTLAPKGLLIEEQRTNLLLQSAEFDNAVWGKSNSTVTANAATAPDGTATADYVVRASTVASVTLQRTGLGITGIQTHTASIYAKAATAGNNLGLRLQGTFPSRADVVVNLLTGAVLFSAAVNFTLVGTAVSNAGNGWYRISITATSDSTGIDRFITGPTAVANGSWESSSTTLSDAYLWGAQLEAGAFPTSYIPTTTAAATRAADVAVMTGANFSNWYRQDEGTLFAETQLASAAARNAASFDVNDGGTNNRVIFRALTTGGADQVVVRSGGATVATLASASSPTVAVRKSAIAYKLDDFAFTAAGLTPVIDTLGAVPVSVNQMLIGFAAGPGEYLGGHLRRISYFPRRLTNSELIGLTS